MKRWECADENVGVSSLYVCSCWKWDVYISRGGPWGWGNYFRGGGQRNKLTFIRLREASLTRKQYSHHFFMPSQSYVQLFSQWWGKSEWKDSSPTLRLYLLYSHKVLLFFIISYTFNVNTGSPVPLVSVAVGLFTRVGLINGLAVMLEMSCEWLKALLLFVFYLLPSSHNNLVWEIRYTFVQMQWSACTLKIKSLIPMKKSHLNISAHILTRESIKMTCIFTNW